MDWEVVVWLVHICAIIVHSSSLSQDEIEELVFNFFNQRIPCDNEKGTCISRDLRCSRVTNDESSCGQYLICCSDDKYNGTASTSTTTTSTTTTTITTVVLVTSIPLPFPEKSEYGEFPWMVAILMKEKNDFDKVINMYQCGGSLIHPQVILTAAHCLQNKKPTEMRVRLGEWDTRTTTEFYDHQDRNVVDIVVHDLFYEGSLINDIALLFLDEPAKLISTVKTICLPPQDMNFDLERCLVSGWGMDNLGEDGKYQAILKKIELPIVPFLECQNALRTTPLGRRFNLHTSFICAGGEPGKDTCKGDGGSPLVCPFPGLVNRYYQAGIVAWGVGCGETGIPGVYVNVAGFKKWIDGQFTLRSIPHNYCLLEE